MNRSIQIPQADHLTDDIYNIVLPAPSGKQKPTPNAASSSNPTLLNGLTPVRCYNYETQLRLSAELISRCLAAETSVTLILNRNAEEALSWFEQHGFSFRQALLEQTLHIYYYRNNLKSNSLFEQDYRNILKAATTSHTRNIRQLVMIEFNTLFASSNTDALHNQIEDFYNVVRENDMTVSGLYSPTNWQSMDSFTKTLQKVAGSNAIKVAQPKNTKGSIEADAKTIRQSS